MQKTSRIFVAGHGGLVGSALVRRLQTQGFHNLLLRTRKELDLTSRQAVEAFFLSQKTGIRFPRRGKGRRDSGKCHLSG